MNKIVATAFIFIALAFGFSYSHAQTPSATESASSPSPEPTEAPFNFQKAYKDYVFTQDVYNRLQAEYVLARSQYFQAQTLASNLKAREATAAFLKGRDDVMIVYLTMLRQRLTESVGISASAASGLFSRIDTEINWYETHKSKISSAATLEDLTRDSDEARKHYSTTEPLIYELLSDYPIGSVTTKRSQFVEILSALKAKTGQIRAAGDHDTSTAERWIIETENKLTRSIDKELEAQNLVLSITSTDTRNRNVNKAETYNQVIFRLDESLAFLKEASSYMKEVIKQLRTKN